MVNNVDKKQFMKILRMIESTDGKNFDHKKVEDGIQAGDAAIGNYGLMPNTVREFGKKMNLPRALVDKTYAATKMSGPTMKQYLEENPDVEEKFANALTNHVLKKGDSEQEAAHAWFMGHNDKYKPEELKNSNQVRKYNKLKQILEKDKPQDNDVSGDAIEESVISPLDLISIPGLGRAVGRVAGNEVGAIGADLSKSIPKIKKLGKPDFFTDEQLLKEAEILKKAGSEGAKVVNPDVMAPWNLKKYLSGDK